LYQRHEGTYIPDQLEPDTFDIWHIDRTLIGEVGCEVVDDTCEFTPGAFDVENEYLTAEFAGRE
jgi:hypothetical protein